MAYIVELVVMDHMLRGLVKLFSHTSRSQDLQDELD